MESFIKDIVLDTNYESRGNKKPRYLITNEETSPGSIRRRPALGQMGNRAQLRCFGV